MAGVSGWRLRARKGRVDAAEQTRRLLEVAGADFSGVAIRPLALGALDPAKDFASRRGQARKLRAAMARIGLVGDEAVVFEQVGDALDTLPRKPEPPRDLGDGLRAALERLENEPAGKRLPFGLRERLTGLGEKLGEADHLDEQARQGRAGRSMLVAF